MNDYQAALEGAAVFDLTGRAIIEVAGPDARMFVHNLCTQEVKNLPVGESREAFLTTNKARVIAHVWITHRETDVLWIDAIAGQSEKIHHHLNRFLISEQVELTDRTTEYGMVRVIGPRAGELSKQLALVGFRQHRLLGMEGFDHLGARSDISSIYSCLIDRGAVILTPETYEILRLEAGLPEYGIDIDETRLAMEVNRTSQAISYNKGCYLGQETIVMARDRGQVNRLMMGLRISSPSSEEKGLEAQGTVPKGAKVFRENAEVGEVTSSVFSPRLGQVIALAYLRRGSWDAGTEVVIDPASDGRSAVVSTLPFVSAVASG